MVCRLGIDCMKTFKDLVSECAQIVPEWMPWDLAEYLVNHSDSLIVDVREPEEFRTMHIAGSVNVPRGVLETACEWEYEETLPELAGGREREIILVCRSGHRSLLAGFRMLELGFSRVRSLRTGLRGWKDDDRPLVNAEGRRVDPEAADAYFTPRLRPDQRRPVP